MARGTRSQGEQRQRQRKGKRGERPGFCMASVGSVESADPVPRASPLVERNNPWTDMRPGPHAVVDRKRVGHQGTGLCSLADASWGLGRVSSLLSASVSPSLCALSEL